MDLKSINDSLVAITGEIDGFMYTLSLIHI